MVALLTLLLLLLLLLPSNVEVVALCLSEPVVVTQQIAEGAELCCLNCPARSSAAA